MDDTKQTIPSTLLTIEATGHRGETLYLSSHNTPTQTIPLTLITLEAAGHRDQ